MCKILRLYYYDAGLIDGRWYIWIVVFFCTQQKFATFVMICAEVSTSFNMTIFQFWLDIIRENVCVPLTEFEIKKRSVFVLLNLKPCTQIRKNVFAIADVYALRTLSRPQSCRGAASLSIAHRNIVRWLNLTWCNHCIFVLVVPVVLLYRNFH